MFAVAVVSYFVSYHLSDLGLSLWLVLPVLVAALAIRQVQYWPVTALWAGLGMIGAMLVMELLGVEGHYAGIGTPHSIRLGIMLGALEVGTDLALAAGLAWMVLQVARVSYDEAGVISKIDIENIFTWRLFAFIVALPLAVYLMRSFEAAVSASLLSVDVKTWSLIQSDLLGYFIMLPAVTGVVLVFVGVPRLEPDLNPIWAYVLGYITLVVGICAAIATETVTITSSTIIPIFGFIVVIGTLMPTLHIAGRLLILNFAGLLFLTQYIAFTPVELIAIVIAFSLATCVVLLLRLIAQIKMNRAAGKLSDLKKVAESYLEAGLNSYIIQDEHYNVVFASKAFTELTGFTVDTLPPPQILYENYDDTFSKQHRQRVNDAAFGEIVEDDELRTLICADGTRKIVKRSNRKFEGADGAIYHMAALEDQTELQRALKAANTFLDSQLTAVAIQREDFSFYYISDVFKEQLGISSIEDMKDPANGFWENRDEAMVLKDREVLRALPTGVLNVHPDPFIFVTAAGERLYFQVQNKWIDNPSGEGRLVLNSFENITELLAQQQRIQDQADALETQVQTDPLTGLWNRLGLNDQLQIVEGAERDQDLAVYLLDVDFFKSVNDTYSHRVGDDLLIAVGNTLRDVGQENAIVARLGGEEFLVATPWIDVETAKDFGGTLRRAVGETQIQSEGNTVSRTTSVGIAKLSRTDSLDTVLSLADLALSE